MRPNKIPWQINAQGRAINRALALYGKFQPPVPPTPDALAEQLAEFFSAGGGVSRFRIAGISLEWHGPSGWKPIIIEDDFLAAAVWKFEELSRGDAS